MFNISISPKPWTQTILSVSLYSGQLNINGPTNVPKEHSYSKIKVILKHNKKTAHAACYCQLNKQEMHTKTKRMTLTTPLVEK